MDNKKLHVSTFKQIFISEKINDELPQEIKEPQPAEN